LSGQFDSVSSNLAFLDPSLSYAGNAVTLTLTRNDTSFSSLARTPNQVAFAQAAESLEEDNEVYRTLLDLGEDEVADTFNKLSGDAHASIASAVMFDDLNLSRAPLGNLRRNLASPERALPYWVQVGGGRQRIDDDGNAGEIIQDHESMLFGGDWPVYGDWRLGGAFGYGQEQLDVDSRDAKADSDSYRYALYGGRDVELSRGTLKLFGGGGYSQHQIDSQRDVRLIDGPERLTRQYDVNTAQGFGELAWHLKFDEPAYVEPFVGLLLIDQRSDSFSEQGGAAALSADSQRNEPAQHQPRCARPAAVPAGRARSAAQRLVHLAADQRRPAPGTGPATGGRRQVSRVGYRVAAQQLPGRAQPRLLDHPEHRPRRRLQRRVQRQQRSQQYRLQPALEDVGRCAAAAPQGAARTGLTGVAPRRQL